MFYIVYCLVAKHRHDDWLSWMRDKHITDVLESGYFVEAWLARDNENDEEDGE